MFPEETYCVPPAEPDCVPTNTDEPEPPEETPLLSGESVVEAPFDELSSPAVPPEDELFTPDEPPADV